MNNIVVEDSIEKIWAKEFVRVFGTAPSAGKTYELLNQHFVLTDMKNNMMFFPGQNIYLPFAITDFHDLLTGTNPGWSLKWHPPSREFLDQNGRFLGHYGERIRSNQGDQLLWCFKELQRNPDSRQAILMYYYPTMDQAQPYPPCTISQQFMVRNGKLHTFVQMRSNDLLSGALYDWQARSLLALHMASWLGIETGNYYHTSQSLHLYKSMREQIDSIDLTEKLSDNRRKIPKVGPVTYEQTEEDIYDFNIILHDLADGFFHSYEYMEAHSELWKVWAKVMSIFSSSKAKEFDVATEILAEIEMTQYFDPTALYLLRAIYRKCGSTQEYKFIYNDIRFSDKFIEAFITQ